MLFFLLLLSSTELFFYLSCERAVVIINVLYIPLCTECLDPDNNERFADPTDVYGFYECIQGVPVKKKCPEMSKWNQVEKGCKHSRLCKLQLLKHLCILECCSIRYMYSTPFPIVLFSGLSSLLIVDFLGFCAQ